MTDKPPVYKCACGRPFQPPHFPYTKRCQCGAEITVNKPARVDPIAFSETSNRGVVARERDRK